LVRCYYFARRVAERSEAGVVSRDSLCATDEARDKKGDGVMD